MAEKPSPPAPPRLTGEPEADAKSMQQWYGAFFENATKATGLLDPARQYVPHEFDPDNLPDPTDSSIANAQQTANRAYTTGVTNSAAAQAAADAAQAAADGAQTAADGAQTAADGAQTTADGAQTAATAAQSTADNALARSVPPGAIIHFPKQPADFQSGGGTVAATTKWLEMDGGVYTAGAPGAALLAFLGNTFGGNGTTTFGVPNCKTTGRFLRSRTAALLVGTTQASAIASHTHPFGTLAVGAGGDHNHGGLVVAGGDHSHGGLTVANGAHSHGGLVVAGGGHGHTATVTDPGHNHGYSGNFVPSSQTATGAAQFSGQVPHAPATTDANSTGISVTIIDAADHQHTIPTELAHQHTISASGTHQHTINLSGTHTHPLSGATATNGSDTETRPEALAVVMCIRV